MRSIDGTAPPAPEFPSRRPGWHSLRPTGRTASLVGLAAAGLLSVVAYALLGARQATPPSPVLVVGQTGPQTGISPASAPAALQVYEASVLVMADSPGAYETMVNSNAFQEALRQMAERVLGPGQPYQVAARVVPRAPLVAVTAQAIQSDDAYRLAHDAARLLVDFARRLDQVGSDKARVLLGTCSPPAIVTRAPDRKSGGPP